MDLYKWLTHIWWKISDNNGWTCHFKELLQLRRRLAKRQHTSQFGQSIFVDDLLKRKQQGFFVEAGAFNGEEISNSLFFERIRGWTGLQTPNYMVN